MSRRRLGYRGWAVLLLVVVFLTVGVPRWLAGDTAPSGSNEDARFSKVCRDHGGTPATTPASGVNGHDRRCTVRYGQRVYLMDAVTPEGFDEDTARFQRQGCEEARRQASAASGRRREAFVYHATTGVCERRS